jgi:hypothetical protein
MLDADEQTEHETDTRPPAVRKPRASFTITMLDDPDFIALRQRGAAGNHAIIIFHSLVMLAKRLRNAGRFAQPVEVIAPMIWSTAREILAAIDLIAEICKGHRTKSWLVFDKRGLRIRSYDKWNEEKRGGPRPGAGRPPGRPGRPGPPKPKPNQSPPQLKSNRIQIDSKVNSKVCASVSVSDSEEKDSQPATRAREPDGTPPPDPSPAPPPPPTVAADPDRAACLATFERWLNAPGRGSVNWTPMLAWLGTVEGDDPGGLALARQCLDHAIASPQAAPQSAVGAVRYVQSIYERCRQHQCRPGEFPTPTHGNGAAPDDHGRRAGGKAAGGRPEAARTRRQEQAARECPEPAIPLREL